MLPMAPEINGAISIQVSEIGTEIPLITWAWEIKFPLLSYTAPSWNEVYPNAAGNNTLMVKPLAAAALLLR